MVDLHFGSHTSGRQFQEETAGREEEIERLARVAWWPETRCALGGVRGRVLLVSRHCERCGGWSAVSGWTGSRYAAHASAMRHAPQQAPEKWVPRVL